MRAGSLRRAASRRGSSDCVGRLRRAAARRAQQTACRPDTGSCSWSGVTGDRARPGSNFLAISAGEGEDGWFPAPQPRIVGGGATPGAGEVFRIFERSFHLNIIWVYPVQKGRLLLHAYRLPHRHQVPQPSSAFRCLSRGHTPPRGQTPPGPHAARSSPQTGTGKHCSMGRAQRKRLHG